MGRKLRGKAKKLARTLDHMNDLVTALYGWVLFLVYEVVVRTYDLYAPIPTVDIGGHFLAGVALGATFFWIGKKKKVYWRNWFVILGSFVMSMLWEGVEIVQEWFIPNPPHLVDVFFWDGVVDVIVALLGTTLYLLIKHFNKEDKVEEFNETPKNSR